VPLASEMIGYTTGIKLNNASAVYSISRFYCIAGIVETTIARPLSLRVIEVKTKYV
jgi:hypothetical protein